MAWYKPWTWFDDDESANPKRFAPQCFLMDFYKSFEAANKSNPYANYVKINVDPSVAVTQLMNKKNGFPLNDLTPAQMSMLVPKFRLFKMYSKPYQHDPKEFYFDDHVSLGGDNLNTQGGGTMTVPPPKRPMSVGFKSFSWEDLGTNPANQGLSFKADMNISCPNMQSLFREQSNGLSFSELVCPKARQKTKMNPEYKNKDNRFRVDVGWWVPPSFNNAEGIWGDAKRKEEIRDAIKASQVSLYLNLTSHELDVKEDGTIELSIEFMASLDSALWAPSADLLYLGKKKTVQIKNLENELNDLERNQKAGETEAQTLRDNGHDDFGGRHGAVGLAGGVFSGLDALVTRGRFFGVSHKLDAAETRLSDRAELIEDRKKELANLKDGALIRKYQQILTMITEKGRFFSVTLTAAERKAFDELNILYQNKTLDTGSLARRRADLVKKFRLFNQDYKPNWTVGNQAPGAFGSLNTELQDAATTKSDVGWKSYIGFDNRAEEMQDAVETGEKKIKAAKDPDEKTINYIYMGDLLEIAFGIVRNNQIEDEGPGEHIWRFLVGQIKIYDFEYQKYVNVNIADLPICAEYFLSFFVDKVIKPNLQKYNIRSFISDVISELLIGSLSPECFGGLAPEARTKVNTQCMTLPSHGDANKPIPAGKTILSSVNGLSQWEDCQNYHNYLFLYPIGGTNYAWKGDYKNDQKNNIMHLQVGADRGLLKSVSFKRQDMPGQREANIQKTVDSGGEVSNLLFSNKYNADLTLFGNTMFSIGTTLYLDPRGMGIGGLSQSNSMASKLGIGGYYFVKKARHTIESGKFETSLETVLQGLGNEKSKLKTITKPAAIETCHSQGTCEVGGQSTGTSERSMNARPASSTGISRYR